MVETQIGFKTVNSLEELEALLAAYQKQNPVKYAAKEAAGEFAKMRAQFAPPVKEEVKKEPKKGKE